MNDNHNNLSTHTNRMDVNACAFVIDKYVYVNICAKHYSLFDCWYYRLDSISLSLSIAVRPFPCILKFQ